MNPDATAEYKSPFDFLKLRQKVQVFRDQTFANYELARKDRDFYNGDQLSPAMKAELAARGQPPVITNKIKPAVNGLLGLIDSAMTDPEAQARHEGARGAADVATKTLRHFADKLGWATIRKEASQDFIIEGTGAAVLGFENGKIVGQAIPWDEFLYDPISRKNDFSDARWLGIAKLLDQDQAEALYGDAYTKLGSPEGDDWGMFRDDRRIWWSDPLRKQVRIVDLYMEDAFGAWHRVIFCINGIIYEGPSAYHDDEGNSICPIVAASPNVKQNGDRYGEVRDMISNQDDLNSRRSKLRLEDHCMPTSQGLSRADPSEADCIDHKRSF